MNNTSVSGRLIIIYKILFPLKRKHRSRIERLFGSDNIGREFRHVASVGITLCFHTKRRLINEFLFAAYRAVKEIARVELETRTIGFDGHGNSAVA